MNYTASSETITINDYIKKCNENKVQKPYLQRKKKWSLERNIAFIRFLLKVRNAVMQFVFNKRIIDSKEVWFVWDGNNRSNAILEFVKAPLIMLPELIPEEYPKEIQDKLTGLSLDKLNKYYNFAYFCDEHGVREWYNTLTAKETEDPYRDMKEQLQNYDFLNIKLPTTIFDGADDEYMVGVYTSVNQPGDPIALQDVIAAKVFNNRYSPTELDHYRSIKDYVKDYYDKTDEALQLNMDGCDIDTAMNLYQILFGFQMYLSKTYSKLMEAPGKSKETSLDMMFELYRSLADVNFGRIDNLNLFLQTIENCVKLVMDIRDDIMSLTLIVIKDKEQCATLDSFLGNAAVMMLITYIYCQHAANSYGEATIKKVKQIIIYKLLCDCIEDKAERIGFLKHNKIYHNNSKVSVHSKLNTIRSNPVAFASVKKENIIELLHYINEEQQSATNVRRKINKFQIICMTLYYNKRVPRDLITNKRDLDHIIPISCVEDDTSICINRLGNLMLIDSIINKKKGNKQLSDSFIQEHGLGYYNYPSQAEYEAICQKNKIVSNKKYNEMCERREQAFFKVVESLLQVKT